MIWCCETVSPCYCYVVSFPFLFLCHLSHLGVMSNHHVASSPALMSIFKRRSLPVEWKTNPERRPFLTLNSRQLYVHRGFSRNLLLFAKSIVFVGFFYQKLKLLINIFRDAIMTILFSTTCFIIRTVGSMSSGHP